MLVFALLDLLHECDNQMGNSNISDHTHRVFFLFCQLRRCHLFCAMHAFFSAAFNPTRFEDATKPVSYFMVLFIWTLLTRFIEYWKISERVLSDHRLPLFVNPTFFLLFAPFYSRDSCSSLFLWQWRNEVKTIWSEVAYSSGLPEWEMVSCKLHVTYEHAHTQRARERNRERNARYEIDTALFNWKRH